MPVGNPRPLMPSSASSTDNFWDDLTASKNSQLRSTMNAGLNNVAPVGVVAPKERNPQTLTEIREEREAILQEKASSGDKWVKFREERAEEKRGVLVIGVILLYMAFK